MPTKARLRGNLETTFFVYLFTVSAFLMHGVFADTVEVSVMEGDSVTLNTGVKTNQQKNIQWYFHNTRIARITGNQSQICTDVKRDGRFRHRLKLEYLTGSLTITNIRNTDSGEYQLQIINNSDSSRNGGNTETIFNVSVLGESLSLKPGVCAERDEMKRKSVDEGESVTLDSGEITNPHDVMKWYFNNIPVAEITGDPGKICTDVQCEEGTERFRDRLKLDHQTGSLTIMNTRNTDTGEYKLQIYNSRFCIIRSFCVCATAWTEKGHMIGENTNRIIASLRHQQKHTSAVNLK